MGWGAGKHLPQRGQGPRGFPWCSRGSQGVPQGHGGGGPMGVPGVSQGVPEGPRGVLGVSESPRGVPGAAGGCRVFPEGPRVSHGVFLKGPRGWQWVPEGLGWFQRGARGGAVGLLGDPVGARVSRRVPGASREDPGERRGYRVVPEGPRGVPGCSRRSHGAVGGFPRAPEVPEGPRVGGGGFPRVRGLTGGAAAAGLAGPPLLTGQALLQVPAVSRALGGTGDQRLPGGAPLPWTGGTPISTHRPQRAPLGSTQSPAQSPLPSHGAPRASQGAPRAPREHPRTPGSTQDPPPLATSPSPSDLLREHP